MQREREEQITSLITRDGLILNSQVANDLIELMQQDDFTFEEIKCYVSMNTIKGYERRTEEGRFIHFKPYLMIGAYELNINNEKRKIGRYKYSPAK